MVAGCGRFVVAMFSAEVLDFVRFASALLFFFNVIYPLFQMFS